MGALKLFTNIFVGSILCSKIISKIGVIKLWRLTHRIEKFESMVVKIKHTSANLFHLYSKCRVHLKYSDKINHLQQTPPLIDEKQFRLFVILFLYTLNPLFNFHVPARVNAQDCWKSSVTYAGNRLWKGFLS